MSLVFFDLETSGLDRDADVLQIAARFPDRIYDSYMMPTKPIPPHATQINGLTLHHRRLYYKGSPVPTKTQRTVLLQLLDYLRRYGDDCTMIAHYCPFDRHFLLRMIEKEGLVDDFTRVIGGFTDTLEMFKYKFPNKKYKKDRLTLKALAAGISLPTEGIHDAAYDAWLLEEIALYHFTKAELIANRMSFAQALKIRR